MAIDWDKFTNKKEIPKSNIDWDKFTASKPKPITEVPQKEETRLRVAEPVDDSVKKAMRQLISNRTGAKSQQPTNTGMGAFSLTPTISPIQMRNKDNYS